MNKLTKTHLFIEGGIFQAHIILSRNYSSDLRRMFKLKVRERLILITLTLLVVVVVMVMAVVSVMLIILCISTVWFMNHNRGQTNTRHMDQSLQM